MLGEYTQARAAAPLFLSLDAIKLMQETGKKALTLNFLLVPYQADQEALPTFLQILKATNQESSVSGHHVRTPWDGTSSARC